MTGGLARALVALVALAVVVVGVPVFLLVAVGNPWPGGESIELRDTSAILVGALAAIGWVIWARLVASIVLEAVEQVRQIHEFKASVRVRAVEQPPDPFELAPPASNGVSGQLAHSLIAALLVLFPLVRSAPTHSPAPELPTRPVVAQTFDANISSRAPNPPMRQRSSDVAVTIMSEPGDTLIGLAERHLGDGGRWREIFDLNRDARQLGGQLTTPSSLRAGWTLRMPADAINVSGVGETDGSNGNVLHLGAAGTDDRVGRALEPSVDVRDAGVEHAASRKISADGPSATDVPSPRVEHYVVQAGDGPWDIAEVLLGDGLRYQEVLDANVGREVAPGVTWTADQRVIHPGWVFAWVESGGAENARATEATVTAESGDTLWDLIEEQSDKRVSWSEVERVAQRNDETATPDGAFVFDAGNPNLIHPGQEFALGWGDSGTTTRGVGAGHGNRVSETDETPSRGERADRDYVDDPENVGDAEDIRDRKRDRQEHSADQPGTEQEDRAGAQPPAKNTGAANEHQEPTIYGQVAGGTGTSTTAPVGRGGRSSSDPESSSLPAPVPLGLGVAAFSAGLLGAVEVTRRRRLRSAKVRDRLPTPPEHVVRAERRLRTLGSNDRLVRVDVAIRSAARSIADCGRRVASVMAHPDNTVLLFTNGPAELPTPWTQAGSTRTAWALPADVPIEQLASSTSGVGAPCAAFTPIGSSPSGADVFVDVEAAGVLAIGAHPDAADMVLAGVTAGLASSVFAESAHLIGVGVGPGCFMDHPNYRLVDSVAEASALAEQLVGDYENAYDSTFVLRTRGTSGESWEPAVVLVGAGHVEELSQWTPRRGAAMVLAGGPNVDIRTTIIRPDAEVWMLEPPGIELTPVGLTADELAEIAALLEWERHGAPIVAAAEAGALVAGSVDTWERGADTSHDGATDPDRADGVPEVDVGRTTSSTPLIERPFTIGPVLDDEGRDGEGGDSVNGLVDDSTVPTTGNPDPVERSLARDGDSEAFGADARADQTAPNSTTDAPLVSEDAAPMVDGETPLANDRRDQSDEVASAMSDESQLGAHDEPEASSADIENGAASAPVSVEDDDDPDEAPVVGVVAVPASAALAMPELEWDIMVRVLGLVDIVDRQGRAAEFTKSKSVELLAWLALHRDRATRSGARSALWEIDVRDATFTNIVSEARRGLARLVEPAEGQEWLGRTLSAALPLHERVVTDVEVLEHHLRHIGGQPTEQARASLTKATEMIRGMPFAEAGYIWPDAEGITSRLVMMLTTCTAELAELALRAGELDQVFWATGVGLQVLSGQEELIALRMRAHAHRNDLAGVRQEWEAYERVLDSDPWSDGEPSPTLVALRHELVAGGYGR